MDIGFYSSSLSHGVLPQLCPCGNSRSLSLFKQAHFGRVKGRDWTHHGPTIKAPFESSTFINLKQSIDLKAESSKLPERIIKQPVSSPVHFSAICTRHFTVSRGRPISLQSPPAPYSEQLLFLSLAFQAFGAHKGEAETRSLRGVTAPSCTQSLGGRECKNSKPAEQQRGAPLTAPRRPRPLVGRGSPAPQKRNLAAPERGTRAGRLSSRLRGGNFNPPSCAPPYTLLP